jgi:UDP-GlcNAc:undecaprenyl-phosphate/decaprenyl-phosphate GlcNAc-1-phosphate transferase
MTMQAVASNPFFVAAIGFLFALVLTYAVRSVAIRIGAVAKPKSDRWHKRPTAMLGGVAIFLATALTYALLVPWTAESLAVLGGSAFLFLVGLVDDTYTIRPYQKLIGQLVGAGILIVSGLKLPLTGFEILDIWITVFWVVGITNAINLLDNMDGLATGIAAVAALSLAMNFAANGLNNELLLISAFVGALFGFLVFNFNPASIFMGDCGSMFIGYLLAGSVLLNQIGGRSRGVAAILAVPVLILFVPIFDTTFVTVLRKLWGRKASQGGRDHTSHRLVALGLSERKAVLMLYAFAAIAGVLSVMVGQIGPIKSFALIGFFVVVLVMLGVYLSKVRVYEGDQEEQALAGNAMYAFLVNVSYKRRIFEVFLDAFLITLAYYSAFAILFDSFESTTNWDLFLKTLPLLVLIKLAAFLVVGVYRGVWRYTSVGDLITLTKGVALGSVLSVLAVLLIYRFQGFSRTVFLLDGLLLLLAMLGSRVAFRVLRQVLPLHSMGDGRRVLIYGAGDGGEMVLRELRNNPEFGYQPVGFVDDDPLKKNKVINGLRVFDGNGGLEKICRDKDISEILISIRNLPPDKLKGIKEACRDSNVVLKRAGIKIEPVDLI